MTFPLLWFQLCMVWWWGGWSPTLSGQAQKSKLSGMTMGKYFLRFKKAGTLDWARPFPADASSTSPAQPRARLISSAVGPSRADSA